MSTPATSTMPPSISLLVVILIWFIVRIGPQNQEVLDHRRLRQVLVRGQLGPLALPDQHGRIVRLEARDALWLACLSDCVHSISDSHLGLDRF